MLYPVTESSSKRIKGKAIIQHLVKLCVGVDSAEDLAQLQAARIKQRRADGVRDNPVHVTRMMPRRGEQVLAGGSLYWVIKGVVTVRQPILALERVVGEDDIKRCRIVLGPDLIATRPQPRRPFQGWRYLDEADAPVDLGAGAASDDRLPAEIEAHLRQIGAW